MLDSTPSLQLAVGMCALATSPDMEESGWVALQNTFSANLVRKREEEEVEEEGSFTVSRGGSDTQVFGEVKGRAGLKDLAGAGAIF